MKYSRIYSKAKYKYHLYQGRRPKKYRFLGGDLSQICLLTHPPQSFCEIWENERWNSGQKRRFSGWFVFLGVWTFVNKISHSCQVGIHIGYGGMTKVLALLLARLSPVPTNPTIVVAHRQLWLLQKYWLHLFEIFANSLSIRRNLKSLVSHQYVLCLL